MGARETARIRQDLVKFTESVVSAMGLDLEVSVTDDTECIRLDLTGDGGEMLLRRKGEALDALQHILNTAFRRSLPDEQRLVVDYQGFRRDKDAELQQMARFVIERVKKSGVPQEIGPLNPYARRLVHLTVAEDRDVSSESIGDAFFKPVVISPRKS